MASRNRIQAEDRDYAPDDELLAKLPQAEANLRCAAVHSLMDAAEGIGEPDVSAATVHQANLMRDALPYADYLAERHAREAARDQLPHSNEGQEIRRGHDMGLKDLKASNPYPKGIDTVHAAVVTGMAKAGETVKPGPLSKERLNAYVRAEVAKEVAQRKAVLDNELAELRAEITAFAAQVRGSNKR